MRVFNLILLAPVALLSGCLATISNYMYPRVEMSETRPVPPAPVAAAAPVANGSIFQAATYRPLFEDHRARLVGDTLTVQIAEKVAASQKSTSSIDKSGDSSAGVTAIPGISPGSFARGNFGANSANTFAGKGSTENTNDFNGVITVTVREVLPNGHLVVVGEKQIGVNANVDVLRFAGQLDPRAIQAGNSVNSTQIANVRLEHRGRGAQADAQAVGWLTRVFLSVLPI